MNEELNKLIDHAMSVGRWKQAIDEADRCAAIYASKAARMQPMAAWALLPLGLGVAGTIALLETETNDEPNDAMWREHLARLLQRQANVNNQYKLWSEANDKSKH